MKNILKRIFIFSFVLLFLIAEVDSIEDIQALNNETILKNTKVIEIYKVGDKEIVYSIIDHYKNDPSKVEFLEYKKEQERLEKERIERLRTKTNIVNFALKFVGNPYVSGGNSLTNGTDCSGFVKLVYFHFGEYMPRTTSAQASMGIGISFEEIEIGDIISYGYDGVVSHSAIYIGNGKIIHASTPELGIRIDKIGIMPIITIRRII